MSIKQQTISGIEWSIAARLANTILQFIISVMLARLLTPQDFGLIGMIIVLSGFAGLFSEMGFGAAIIQGKEIEQRHLSSVFWLNIAMGLILTFLIVAVAPIIAEFYNEPRLKPLAVFISLNFLISSMKIVQSSLLNRSMNFRGLAIAEIAAIVISGVFAITMASIGMGVWSLALQMIIYSSIGSALLWLISDWRPSFEFEKDAVKDLLGFTKNLFGFNIFNYWSRNIDNLLIGKFMGSSALGIYSRSYNLMLMPISQISATVGQVMLPSLSKIQDDKALAKRIYLKTIGAIALVTLPIMTGFMVVCESFVLAVLGPSWSDVIPVLRILCIAGITQSVCTTVGWIYCSQGRTDLMFRWGIIAGTIGIISFIIGVLIGSVIAVAYCYAIVNVLLLYHNFAIPGKLIDMTFHEVVCEVIGTLGCAITMAAGVSLLEFILPPQLPHLYKLLIQIILGIIFYVLLIHFIKLKAYVQAKELIREQWQYHFAH